MNAPIMQRISITPVTTFVDWNSQIHAAGLSREKDIIIQTSYTLKYVGKIISRMLHAKDPSGRFDVTLRAYYGWHKGFEPTAARIAMRRLSSDESYDLSIYSNVHIRQNLFFGDELLMAMRSRFHVRLACHLPNTLRDSARNKRITEEKMVDTAIASDLLYLTLSEPDRWLVVLGEDDDLVPPVLTAEALRNGENGRVLLVRQRGPNPFLKLDGLTVEP